MATQDTTKNETETSAERKTHVHGILSKMSNVMLLTYASPNPRPLVFARPLHVTKLEPSGAMWFIVALDSAKVREAQAVDVAYVNGHEGNRWVHLTGHVRVVTDRAKIRELWGKMQEVFFPHGADDPNVGLLYFEPEHAEYWDNSGMPGVRYLFEIARALVTGTAADADAIKGIHGEVGEAGVDTSSLAHGS